MRVVVRIELPEASLPLGEFSNTGLLWKLRTSRLAVMSNMFRLCAVFLGLAVLLVAQNQNGAPYIIKSGDTLSVLVLSDQTRTVLVDGDGAVTLPLVGKVKAEGLNLAQFTQRIKDALATFISNPEVTTSVQKIGTTAPR
jgi:protein involved in polysaccharide export with SLBB domain